MRVTLEERFWSKVDRRGDSECWLWKANTNWMPGTFGDPSYGRFKIEGKNELAHRVSWSLTNGPIPDGLWVLHHCDNPRCVNPSHLFLGTRSDNMRDCVAKGRFDEHRRISSLVIRGDRNPARLHPEALSRGTDRHQARLDDDLVREIRLRAAAGEGYCALGRCFGVTDGTIRAAVLRRTWRHVV